MEMVDIIKKALLTGDDSILQEQMLKLHGISYGVLSWETDCSEQEGAVSEQHNGYGFSSFEDGSVAVYCL